MKRIINLILGFMLLGYLEGYTQCLSVDLDDNPYICGLYGDANGVSNWDWEFEPDPNSVAEKTRFCQMWQARTNSANNQLTAMNSPFKTAGTDALLKVSTDHDYTRAKGWELLQRDFGCKQSTSYPYFILYNKYTSQLRVFVYQKIEAPQYTQMVITLEHVPQPYYPATLSMQDALITTPDKFLATSGQKAFGSKIVSVTSGGGSGKWFVCEFNMGFDPNIGDAKYQNATLKFSIYGEAVSDITADITGTSATGDKVYDFSYGTQNGPGAGDNSGEVKFTTQGEKFIKFGKTIEETRDGIHKAALGIFNSATFEGINIFDEKDLQTNKGKIKALAWNIEGLTDSDGKFGSLISNVASALGIGGNVLKFVGSAIGFFSGSSSPAPTFTSYNLKLKGTITCKSNAYTIYVHTPGAPQAATDNYYTYYKCPFGIFNLKNTPQAERVTYERTYSYLDNPTSNSEPYRQKANYISLKMTNDLQAVYNEGVGLDLVNVQAAIVGQVQLKNNAAAYDLIRDHGNNSTLWWDYNYMLPDLQAGFLEVATFDPTNNLHTFQTPYVNLECLNGLAFNARAETDVFLRVKAILKKKNDPAGIPLIYIRDYKIDFTDVPVDNGQQFLYVFSNDAYKYAPPYSNYSEVPDYRLVADKLINNYHYTGYALEKADNTITGESSVYIAPGADVTYKAGSEVILNDGFQAEVGSNFEATLKMNQRNITCGARQWQGLSYANCYNTTISANREETKPTTTNETITPELLKVYPIPTNGKLFIEGVKANSKTTITILDQSGRTVKELRPASFDGGRIDVDVSSLSNGVYFVKIQTLEQITTRKIVVSK